MTPNRYNKNSGYKSSKKSGKKSFYKKNLNNQTKNESFLIENYFDGPDSVNGNVATFNITNEITIKVTVPEDENEDLVFAVKVANKPEVFMYDPSAIEHIQGVNNILTQDSLEDMGNVAIEQIRKQSPFKENMNFENLYGSIFREQKKN